MPAPKKSSDQSLSFKTTVALNQEEDAELENIARYHKRSKSFILRSAFQHYFLENQGETEKEADCK